MIRLIIAERAKLKGDYFKQVSPDELTDTGIGQMIHEAEQLIKKLEDLHAKLNEDEDSWPLCRHCGSNLGDDDTLDQPDEDSGVCATCKAEGKN